MQRSLHWFRADLRLADNTAFLHALQTSESLFTVFIITPKTFALHNEASIKVQFMLDNLKYLSHSLLEQGIPLLVRKTDYFSECPTLLQTICVDYQINKLFFNKQYEVNEARRDEEVKLCLRQKGVEVYSYDDQTVMAPGSILSQLNQPLQVFTPFKKSWLREVHHSNKWRPKTVVKTRIEKNFKTDPVPASLPGFESTTVCAWPAGEEKAHAALHAFCSEKINNYAAQRDVPFLEATSQLSPYLSQGILSPRQCIAAMLHHLQVDTIENILNQPGPSTWLSELIWREFYKHLLYHFPKVCCGKPLRPQTEKIAWRDDVEAFQAWCKGITGFPFIDAAMRQLNQTGWMHNRLRMLTAMFLTKILQLDWRWGERYFMQQLIDGDLAANNGGWQWSASTGTDAAPYFRIMNPLLQSERYDPQGQFIKKYCPELKELDISIIHNPYERGIKASKLDYPLPIVNYQQKRQETLAMWKNITAFRD